MRGAISTARQRFIAILSILLLGIGLGIGAAAPAQAAPQDYCGSGRTCLWLNHSYKTAGSESNFIGFAQCIRHLVLFSFTPGGNATDAVSIYNNGNFDRVWAYDQGEYVWHSNGVYPRFYLDKKKGDGNIRNNAGYVKNISWSIGSARFESVPTSCS